MAACCWSAGRLSWLHIYRYTGHRSLLPVSLITSSDSAFISSPTTSQKRYAGGYLVHGFVEDFKPLTDFEVVKSPPEWKYVERLLPMKLVPMPTPKAEYPSGWIPPNPDAKNGPYYVARTKNHMLPAYIDLSDRGGMRKITVIRRIHGDIWKFELDLRDYFATKLPKIPDTRVHELTCEIEVRGEHLINVERFLYSKGF